jgi:hypothetical protein
MRAIKVQRSGKVFIIFRVKGPFRVPFHCARNGAKLITNNAKAIFWSEKARKYRSRIGCYIFAINNGRHYSPGYIGVATSSFGGEVFTESKLNRYNEAMADYKKGRPVLFLVVAPLGRGKPAKSKALALEKYLIQTVKAAHPRLRNKIGTSIPRWGIAGVLRGGKGKTAGSARALRRIMGIE